MSMELAELVRGKCSVVAVSDAYKLAPWADALVSNDANWWRAHRDAMDFPARKFTAAILEGVERIRGDHYGSGINSGLQGMRVAHMMGATRILLLGFDMHGTHYFGKHPAPLRNTTPKRFRDHINQFKRWRGCEVWNCTPGSALKQFPYVPLDEALAQIVDQTLMAESA